MMNHVAATLLLAVLLVAQVAPAASQGDHPPIPIRFAATEPGFVTLVIDDADGRRVRNLLSEIPFEAGEHVVWWDGADDTGRLQTSINCNFEVIYSQVAPGQYTARGLWRPQIDLRYEFTVYNPGRPPWATADPASEWLANHSPPSGVLFVPEEDADRSPAGPVPGGLVLVCSHVAEGGSGLAWLDLEGAKRYGQHWIGGVWTGATHLARDAGPDRVDEVYAYTGAAWEASAGGGYDGPRSELRLAELLVRDAKAEAPRDGRFGRGDDRPLLAPFSPYQGLLPNGAEELRQPGEDTRYAFPDAEQTGLSGLAVHNARLVAALPKMDELLWVDASGRRIIGTVPLDDPRGIAFDADGRLLALSGTRLLRFDIGDDPLEMRDPKVLVARGLEDPIGLALDSGGRTYISDRGEANQVKVFNPRGRRVRTIGKAGKPVLGPYDPLQMHNPNGVTIDGRGRLWVAETDSVPKRVSVWTIDGEFVEAFYGPMEYGGGGALDPGDPSRFYYNGIELTLDWQTGSNQPSANYYQPAYDALGLPSQFRSRAPETAIHHDGRCYLTDCYNVSPTNAANSAAIWLLEDGVARPVAALGDATDWPVLSGMFPPTANYSVRWTGQVQSRHSETYTFATITDDGVRLWVDDELLIDNWTPHGTTEDTGAIDLEAGKRYDLRLEYFQEAGGATVRLLWAADSEPKAIIPSSVLYPSAEAGDPGGLTGEYFAKADLTEPVSSRLDPMVDFDWSSAPPEALVPETTSPFRSRLPDGVTPGERLAFTWSDLDGDGAVQPAEVTLIKGDCSGITVMPDLSFAAAYLDGAALRFPPVSMTDAGVPCYGLARGETLAAGTRKPSTSGGGQALVGEHGWTVLTVPPEPFEPQASMAGVRDGKPMWTYPSCWPGLHPSHDAPLPDHPGQLIGTTRLLGGLIRPRGSNIGQLWAINGNKGNTYLFTTDGLFVATLFEDCRTAAWDAPKAERGMLVNELSQNEENFWPMMTQVADGRIFLVTGGNGGSVIAVEGLEKVRRLPGLTVEVTADQLREAGAWRVAVEETRRQEEGPATLLVGLPAQTPTLDGVLDEWPEDAFVPIDARASAALAVAEGRLWAAFRTGDARLLENAGESLPLLFKSGGGLELMVGSVPGGLRLLVARVGGAPAAVLYRPTDPAAAGEGVPFASPMRTIVFDRVDEVTDQLDLAADGAGNYELSVPVDLLALDPAGGAAVSGDVGLLRGNGHRTLQRVYWSNKSTSITSDIPSEAELRPDLWGEWQFAADE